MVMEVAVEGTDIDPTELKELNWITKVTKKVKELQDQGRREKQSADAPCNTLSTAAAGTATNVNRSTIGEYKARLAGKQLAEKSIASHLPRLPQTDHKVILRPKGGLALTKLSVPYVGGMLRLAADVQWEKGKEEDQVVLNDKQGTITYSTPRQEDALKVLSLRKLPIGDKAYEVTSYMAAPENCGRGVVHGIDLRFSEEELEVGFSHRTNPPIIGVRRMGRSESVIITFADPQVPRWVRCFGSPIKCFLYRKKYEVCFKCGDIGHRSDVCSNNPTDKCRKCGDPSPASEHRCVPKCQLCGKEHETGDKRCKVLYRTPYVLKKRQWERKLGEQARKEEEADEKRRHREAQSTIKASQRASRRDQSRDRARSMSRSRSKSRNRSVSFPRLPPLRTETISTANSSSENSGSVRASLENSKTNAPKVGWVSGTAQDANAEVVRKLTEQNKFLMEQNKLIMEQNAELKRQLDEIKTVIIAKASEQVVESMQVVHSPPLEQLESKLNDVDDKLASRVSKLEKVFVAMAELKSLKKVEDRLLEMEKRMDRLDKSNIRRQKSSKNQEFNRPDGSQATVSYSLAVE